MTYNFNPRLMWKIVQYAVMSPTMGQSDHAWLKYVCDDEEYFIDILMSYEKKIEGKPELFCCSFHVRKGHHTYNEYFMYVRVFFSGVGDNWGADYFIPDFKIFFPVMLQLTNWTTEDLDHHMTVLALTLAG